MAARHAALPRARAGPHAVRAAARPAARGGRHRAAERLRAGRRCSATRSHDARHRAAVRPLGRGARRHVRRGALLPAPGDRGLRGGRPGRSPTSARTLGAGSTRAVLAGRAAARLAAAWSPAGCSRFARGIGEFGATIIFAGNVQGETQHPHAGRLPAARGRHRRRARALGSCWWRSARGSSLSYKLLGSWRPSISRSLSRLRAFALDLSWPSATRGRGARRPVRGGQDDRPARVARAARARTPGGIALRRRGLVRAPGGVDLPPERRSVGYVPQHHALFPHLTVAAQRRASPAPTRARVDELLARLRHRPARRRAARRASAAASASASALARALAREPGRAAARRAARRRSTPRRARIVRDELADDARARLAIPTLLVTHDFARRLVAGRPRRR